MNPHIDDGSDKPLGYTTPDGYLEVRESVDKTGTPFRGYHETELGAHDRWLRQAPDLYEKYQQLLTEHQQLKADRIENLKSWEAECYRLLKAYDEDGKHETAEALKIIADILREGWQELEASEQSGDDRRGR